MKNIIKIVLILCLILIFGQQYSNVFASVDLSTGTSPIRSVSMGYSGGGDIIDNINYVGFSVLRVAKVILQGVLLIYMVYIGAQMIWSMGNNEEELGKAKRQIRYTLIGLLFLTIPGSIYQAFRKDDNSINIDGRVTKAGWTSNEADGNVFIDFFSFSGTLNDNILAFLKVLIFGIAVMMIVYEGIKVMTARGREEQISEAKNKIVYSLLALVFLGFIEVWKKLAFSGSIGDGVNIIGTMAKLALFFAGPTAIFFLTLAGYYYITSQGDEDKVKKAKHIVINVVIATVLLLASYSFLLDLSTL